MSQWNPSQHRPFRRGHNSTYNPYDEQINYGRNGHPETETSSSTSQSSSVTASTLTPLAKEFIPGVAYVPTNETQNHKQQGAIRKDAYWNRDKRQNENRDRRVYTNSSKANNENFMNKSRNSSFKDFNQSVEQTRVLQETKKFMQQVKSIDNESRNQNDVQASHTSHNHVDYGNKGMKGRSESREFFSKNNKSTPNHNSRVNFNMQDGIYKKHKYGDDAKTKNARVVDTKTRYQRDEKHPYKNWKEKTREFNKKLDPSSRREQLEQLVINRNLECLVCCDKLRHTDQVWSCKQCFHILHLQCTRRWAESSKLESGWRCPACQTVYSDVPTEYRCYCVKQQNPLLQPGGTPHSCGEVCGRVGVTCSHCCTLICHPGPCPECTVMAQRSCGCGSTQLYVKCNSSVPITCSEQCSKVLACGLHTCKKKCHPGDCDQCSEYIRQECFCGKQGRKVKCTVEIYGSTTYECGEICDQLLLCGNHRCQQVCHAGPCRSCALAPNQISTCYCGKTSLVEERKSCLDPIPCCNKICNKPLLCGQPSSPHLCEIPCHEGPCLPCLLTTKIRCRCGHMDKELPCSEVTTKADDARCEKKCTKKRLCGKHKCNQLCCIEVDHVCPLQCNHLLSCGQHRCDQPCHKGRCPPCWNTSFDELYCECGASVLYPPVPCGTRPPQCSQPCSRPNTCGHDITHSCHTGSCPPCTILTKRWCHGHHEQRATIPCHQDSFSCGLACNRTLPCGRHKCIQACHEGPCRIPCTQPCSEIRPECGHNCNQPCHELPCPETVCKYPVKVTCQCGLRKSSRICMELASEYQSIAMSHLASKMEEMQSGHVVDLTDLTFTAQRKSSLKTLECSEDCRLAERNRRLAFGLQICNPDLSAKLTPRYSDFMRGWAKKDPKFCQIIHEKLSELVQLAKQSKQRSRSYSFETMNRDKRHFVHEYCEHFGCESAAYDPEPNRNVVASAFKDKSWLPSYSLLEVIRRESGQRKVPGPQQLGKVSSNNSESVSLKLPGRTTPQQTPSVEIIDYFNNPPM